MTPIKTVKDKLSDGRKNGYSLEFRFIATFLVLIITAFLTFGVIFAAFGFFDFNRAKTSALLEHELSNITTRIKSDYNTITSYSLSLSESLSLELSAGLDENKVEPSALSEHPEILTDLLDEVFPTMTAELRALRTSGVFLILNATINPSLAGAENSRAGLFIKNIAAQNHLSATNCDLRYLYGPVSLAQSRKMTILPQWSLEYDVSVTEAFGKVVRNAEENISKPLSQLYYWTAKETDGGVDYGMYCCVPVIVGDTVVGMCGYEVSSMQFKLSYAPEITGQDYAFCMLAPSDDENIYFEKAMFAGNYAVTSEQPDSTTTRPSGDGFLSYRCGAAGNFVGNHSELLLYSASSVYAECGFTVVLLMPQEQIAQISRGDNLQYIGVLILLLIVFAVASVILCRRNMKPVRKAFDEVRSSKSVCAEKTFVREIDDLFEFLSERDRENEEKLRRAEQERLAAIERQNKATAETETMHEIYGNEITQAQYNDFVSRLRTLTEKERYIYDLYLQGKKAQEIAAECAISINTVKFHNKNIYDKLGINSRKELLRYAGYRNSQTAKAK